MGLSIGQISYLVNDVVNNLLMLSKISNHRHRKFQGFVNGYLLNGSDYEITLMVFHAC